MYYAVFKPAEQAEPPQLLVPPLIEWLWLLMNELEKLATQHQEQRRTAMRGQRGASLAKKAAKPSDSTDTKSSNKQQSWQAECRKEYLRTSRQLDLITHEIGKCHEP